ncbi:MAG: two-component system, OmpR family, sensor kinase [Acidimicrobiaceae bacterium]|nr:two-component system, OmpR family, sensor kinase [Acidimicrobiaceae bacterium]
MTLSLRARLLAASLALTAFGLLAADVATYRALRSSLYRRVDGQLDVAHTTIQRSLLFQNGAFVQSSVEQLGELVPGVYVQLQVSGRPVLVTNPRRAGESLSEPKLPAELKLGRIWTVPSAASSEAGYRLLVSRVDPAVVIVGIPLSDTAATLQRLLGIEVLVSLLVFAAAAAAGIWLVRLGLRPLGDIEATAATIAAGDMTGRVALADPGTEVGRLGAAVNTMLDSLDAAFAERQRSESAALSSEQRMRRFVADASHELRTPVAAVRAYAELYRRGADSRPEDLARLLSRIEEEAARMGVLVDDLLLLTRLDEGRPLARQAVDVGAVASDAVAAARAVDPHRPLSLDVEGSVEVLGDKDRLRQVLDNLLANVRAHTPEASPASVRVAPLDGRAVVEVADSGPGLSAEDRAKVFERFYRADPARGRDKGGSGLGLSIVAAIVAAHGGSTSVRDRDEGWSGASGAVFRIDLPLLT